VPWETSHHEAGHGRNIVWTLRALPAPDWVMEEWPGSATIIAVHSQGTRDGQPVDETRYYVTSLRTSTKTLLRLVRNLWSIENSWHLVRGVKLSEDAHRYREANGVQIVAMLRTMAINSLRLSRIWSMTEGIAALAHDIKGLLMLLG
jgi:predicted transposase YbfD/YdcC